MFPRMQTVMFLLGTCPHCSKEDTINGAPHYAAKPEDQWRTVRCEQCRTVWYNVWNLIDQERAEGRTLMRVEWELTPTSASLEWPPRNKVPFQRHIIEVLAAALITRFRGLRLSQVCEGGVDGMCWARFPRGVFYAGQWWHRMRGYVEFRNLDDKIGLEMYELPRNAPVKQKALRWYATLFKILFFHDLAERGGRIVFRRGSILKLSENDRGDAAKLWEILFLALQTKAREEPWLRRFPYKVFSTLQAEKKNIFSGKFLAGLTDEDIVKIFVPPPLYTLPPPETSA